MLELLTQDWNELKRVTVVVRLGKMNHGKKRSEGFGGMGVFFILVLSWKRMVNNELSLVYTEIGYKLEHRSIVRYNKFSIMVDS